MSSPQLTPRSIAPSYEGSAILGSDFIQVHPNDYKGKWVVLFFYPLDWTFVCPTELLEFSNKYEDFNEIDAYPIGVSVDSCYSHHAWAETPRKKGGLADENGNNSLKYPLIGDLSKDISNRYGVLYGNTGHTFRATFIIDPNNVIRHISMNDPPVGRNVDELIRLVKGYQYADTYGEVCPVKWTEGSETIIPNPSDKLKYFDKN